VLDRQRQCPTPVAYPLLFSGEERRPARVVLDDADDAGLKTDRLSDGDA
jgi:hypothetical protein